MQSGSVAIGVIGAGIMGQRLLTAIVQQDSGLLHACGLWDPAPAAMQRMATAFPQVPRMADAAAVIAASDCVYIASPPASHLDHARAALAAGKSFFGEKPLAVDVADARAFVAEAGGRGAVNFPFASSDAVAAIRRPIDNGWASRPGRGPGRWMRPAGSTRHRQTPAPRDAFPVPGAAAPRTAAGPARPGVLSGSRQGRAPHHGDVAGG